MEKGKIKIKKKGSGELKKELKVGGKEISIPKEFVFSEEYSGECEVEFENHKLVKIIIQGKEIPKSDAIAQEKQAKTEAKQKQAEEEKKRLEEERKAQKHQNQSNQSSSKAENLYKVDNTKLPQNTKSILNNLDLIDNYALKLNKTVNFIDDNRKEDRQSNSKFEIPFDFKKLEPLFQSIQTKQENQLKNLGLAKTENQKLSLDWRLALGLGNASVYETSITLHHIYGIPYIPASAIKGITHHFALENAKSDDLANIKKIFGVHYDEEDFKKNPVNPEILSDKNEQGYLIFFDAFPTSAPVVEPDIMNVHYKDYYNESVDKAKTYPTDYQSPNPIPFLTVKDCSFQFIIGVKSAEDTHLLETAKKWLAEALTQKGIGAKTAVGYGYMQ